MKKIRILSFILAAVIMTSLFAGCAAKKEDEKKTKKDSSETETEIVTDENGETTVIYVEKKVNTEKDTEDGGESEEESEAETGKDGKPAKTDGKKPAETTGAGKEDGKTAKKDSGGKNTAETTGKESFEPIEIPMETQAKKDPNDAKLPDGIKIESVSISRLEDMVNIDFKVSNSKDFDQIVDFSYVVMKINNTTEVLNTFNTMPIQGGKTITCSMPIEDDSADLSIGRSVSVYYGNDLIGIAVVSPF